MLDEIAEEIRKCRRCDLWKTRKNTVPGEGNENAEVMFIGEAPGRKEDETGKPFVGAAGDVLNEMLDGIELKREDVFITSVLKCRPPNNRNPRPDEIAACSLFLEEQMRTIKPRVICTLGNVATAYLLRRFGMKPQPISRIHGKPINIDTLDLHFTLIPMYHPAAVIYNAGMRNALVNDFKTLKKVIYRRTR